MKKMMLAAALIAGTTQGQNLLSNGGFESQVNFDGNDVGNWNAFFSGGSTFQQAESVAIGDAFEGLQALQLGNFEGADQFNGVTQNVPVSAGAEYTFAFQARELAGFPGINSEYRIEWKDAGGAFIGGQFDLNTPLAGSLTTDWQAFSLTAVAPAGAASATVVIAVQTFGVAAPQEGFIQIDDASFAIPSPASAALLGLGGLAAARRRR